MLNASTVDTICELLHKDLEISERILPDTELLRDLQLDSLQQMNFVVLIENRFQVCLEPEDEAAVVTIADVARLVERKRALDGRAREDSADA